eukprot:7386802-Pyramimonas_sp.AAC.1
MHMRTAQAEEYPDSQQSVESGRMMLQDSDVCDDSELLLAALTLVDSVLPDDVQRHAWYAKGRWRQALERAITM